MDSTSNVVRGWELVTFDAKEMNETSVKSLPRPVDEYMENVRLTLYEMINDWLKKQAELKQTEMETKEEI